MIDWAATAGWLAAVAGEPERWCTSVDRIAATAPPFRNREYPVSPSALYVRAGAVADHAARCRDWVAVLEACIALYAEEPAARSFYGLSPAAERLVLAEARHASAVPVCRVDGYLAAEDNGVRFLESNADAPAGTLFTPRLNAVHDRLRHEVGANGGLGEPRFDDDRAFLDLLLAEGERAGVRRDGACLAVLAPSADHPESHALVDLATASGVEAFLADARSVAADGGRVRFGGRPATLCWNKVNTSGWRSLVEGDPDLVDRWVAALAADGFVHLAPFASRYVAESKLTMAFVHTPLVRERLGAGERAVVDSCVPEARRVPPAGGAAVDLDGCQHELVLKQPYDIRGDGVTIGPASDRRAWSAAVARTATEPHAAQAYVAPVRAPVLGGDGVVRSMAVSLDSFVFAGELVGFGAKASTAAKVNVFQGGMKIPVRVAGP